MQVYQETLRLLRSTRPHKYLVIHKYIRELYAANWN